MTNGRTGLIHKDGAKKSRGFNYRSIEYLPTL